MCSEIFRSMWSLRHVPVSYLRLNSYYILYHTELWIELRMLSITISNFLRDNHYSLLTVVVSLLSEKQREFYKNAKNVNKFKKLVKQQNQHNGRSLAQEHDKVWYLISCLLLRLLTWLRNLEAYCGLISWITTLQCVYIFLVCISI